MFLGTMSESKCFALVIRSKYSPVPYKPPRMVDHSPVGPRGKENSFPCVDGLQSVSGTASLEVSKSGMCIIEYIANYWGSSIDTHASRQNPMRLLEKYFISWRARNTMSQQSSRKVLE